jgi:hypothetical protein
VLQSTQTHPLGRVTGDPGTFEPDARRRRPTDAASKMSGAQLSDEFDNLDAIEKAAVEAALDRCRALVDRIVSELRKPKHFDDVVSLADFLASLEHAARILERRRR